MKKHLEGGALPDGMTPVDYWEFMLSEYNLDFIKNNALIDANKSIKQIKETVEKPNIFGNVSNIWRNMRQPTESKQKNFFDFDGKSYYRKEEAEEARQKAVKNLADINYQKNIAEYRNNLEKAKRREPEIIRLLQANPTPEKLLADAKIKDDKYMEYFWNKKYPNYINSTEADLIDAIYTYVNNHLDTEVKFLYASDDNFKIGPPIGYNFRGEFFRNKDDAYSKLDKVAQSLVDSILKEIKERKESWSVTTKAGGSKKKRSKKGKNTIKKVSRNKVSRKRRNKK